MSDQTQPINTASVSELPILGFDAIELYVGNAKQAAYFYNAFLGFDIIAYQGPETGNRDICSYVLKQGTILLVVTAALFADHPVTTHVKTHGDGVKDIGFQVENVQQAYQVAISRGAKPILAPTTAEDLFGKLTKATIATYGETTHTFYQRQDYRGYFAPGYKERSLPGKPMGLTRLDHVVGNVEKGKMMDWVHFYQSIFGFYVLQTYDDQDIRTDYTALMSMVMANQSGTVKMPLNEPAPGLKKSQIEEYLEYYQGPGVHHLAIATDDILNTVAELRQRGLPLMTVPETYYTHLTNRVGTIKEPLEELARLGILVDRDEDGYLLQIFTQPLQDRPTFFVEIIQRQGAEGFGKGNFKALFEAIERDQAQRGNL